ncbi:ribonuclease H-like domain-containing protein [Tanacetum coccineum]
MMMYSATNSLYPCVYLATHQPPIQFVSSSAQQSPIHYYGAPAMSPAPVSYAPTPPHAFHTMTLQNPNWNMDTGASSHLADNTSILTSCSNSSIYPSVFVGNGHSIPVTHTGHSFLHTSSKPLHLNHILVTPHIIKNLISVRQFTRDNDVSVEFDAYGFSVKDYQTGRILLRCDSTGDLYPVTQQPSSQNPVVLLSFSSTTWHRRLGHPGDDVLRRLESGNLISCHKPKLPTLCHACQLGKHAKLPFYNSKSLVDSVFEIIHSDIWTSPIPSESGIKYYAIFLDHFSHFVWVYPLHKKSDLFDNFVAFRAYVNRQFNVDIKALQCDHGGEYDNTRFHELFRQNGIQFRFSCPPSSITFLQHIIALLHGEFDMTDLGSLNYFLGFFAQRTASDTESKLGCDDELVSDPTLYRCLAGALQYLTFTRPNLSYVAQQLHVFFTAQLTAYTDADWAGCPVTHRAEAEYRGVANVVAETAWLQNLLLELHAPLSTVTIFYCDNVSVVYLSTNPVQHQHIKHIKIDIHFVRDYVASGQLPCHSATSYLPPRTSHLIHVRAAATWQAVIGQPLPRVSKSDPLDTSLVVCAGLRVNGSGQRVATCHHMTGSHSKPHGIPCGFPRGIPCC